MHTRFKTKILSLVLAVCISLAYIAPAYAADAPGQPVGGGKTPYGITYLWESVETGEGGIRARFNWMTSTDITESKLFYATKSDFESNGHLFTDVAEGTSQRIDLTTQLASLGYKGGTGDYDGNGSYCYAPVQSHKAETAVLEPATEYVYCVGDGGENTTSISEPRTFTTPSENIDSFDMLFFSDAQQGGGGFEDTQEGYQEDLHMALSLAVEDFPDAAFLMSGGDQVNFGFDTWEWDNFFNENQDIFDRYPLYLAVGNHECGGDSNGLGWVDPDLKGEPVDSTASALLGRYNPPENGVAYYGAGDNGSQPMVTGHAKTEAMSGNYYFIYDNTLFLVIDYQDHTDENLVKAEQEWVKSVVKNHPEVTWRVAVMHESMFGYRVTDPTTGLNRGWTDAFDAAGVDVVLMGHDHIYTRTKYFSNGGVSAHQESGSGTVYITAASANTDNRSYYYQESPYVEVHSEGGYGRAYIALTISDTEIRLTTKGFDTEQDDSLVTLEDHVVITSKPRTPNLDGYAFPAAPAEEETLPLSGVAIGGRAKAGLTAQAVVAPQGALAQVQWQRADTADGPWENISGANMAYYTCQESDIGKYLRAVVTGADDYTGVVTSEAAGPVEAAGSSGVNEPGYIMDLSDAAVGTLPEEWTVETGEGQFTVARLPEEAGSGNAIQVKCDAENSAAVSFGKQGSVFYAAVDLYVQDWGPITDDEGAKYDIVQLSFGDDLGGVYGVTKLFTWGDCGGEVYMTVDGNYVNLDGGQLALTETGWYKFLYRFDLNNNTFTVSLNDALLYKDEACTDSVFSTEAFEVSSFCVESLTAGSTLYLSRMSVTDNAPDQPDNSSPFTDVDTDDWFSEEVEYVYANGLMVGTSAVTFDPAGTVTRGTVTTILARLAGVDTAGSAPWYQAGTDWAVAQGVADGTNPEGTITREQVAAMLYRYAGSPAVTGDFLSGFAGAASVSDWAVSAMNWAVSVGLIQGDDAGLNPGGTASRAELATMLMRFCENVQA